MIMDLFPFIVICFQMFMISCDISFLYCPLQFSGLLLKQGNTVCWNVRNFILNISLASKASSKLVGSYMAYIKI